MSPRPWAERVADIIDAITAIQAYLTGMTLETLAADRRTQRAVAFEFGVIGEAAGTVPPAIQQRYPGIPWQTMRGMRNMLYHQYWRIDTAVLWHTAHVNLPPLLPALRALLRDTEPEADHAP